jgi:hypothetical protein
MIYYYTYIHTYTTYTYLLTFTYILAYTYLHTYTDIHTYTLIHIYNYRDPRGRGRAHFQYCWKYIQNYCQIYCWKYDHNNFIYVLDVYACILLRNTCIYMHILTYVLPSQCRYMQVCTGNSCIYCCRQGNILLIGSHICAHTYIFCIVRIVYFMSVCDTYSDVCLQYMYVYDDVVRLLEGGRPTFKILKESDPLPTA